ncbi:GPW/gp25 family protein [Bordetella sp. 2513F-2]
MSTYLGMDARTGLRITDGAHLQQSVAKILGTSIGTRLRRRPFGSKAPDLIDAPANRATLLQLYAAGATALMAWEPRLKLRSISANLATDQPGRVEISVAGETSHDGGTQGVSLTVAMGG